VKFSGIADSGAGDDSGAGCSCLRQFSHRLLRPQQRDSGDHGSFALATKALN